MKYSIVIPAHNEEKFIRITLDSIVKQTLLPTEVVVVNDHSTDKTKEIIESYVTDFPWIKLLNITSTAEHQPGSKVILAFNKGFDVLDQDFDVIVKLDADLDLPLNYFEKVMDKFSSDQSIAMVGGFAYIEKNNEWILENLTDQDHIRGAFKAYRKEAFEKIGGLRTQMGWDTVDELLCKYFDYKVVTIPELKVKHLKPTGANYQKSALLKQGEAYFTLGYGFWITLIAAMKLAKNKNKFSYFFYYLKGYLTASNIGLKKMVNPEQEKFIRNYRWKNIKKKLGL